MLRLNREQSNQFIDACENTSRGETEELNQFVKDSPDKKVVKVITNLFA